MHSNKPKYSSANSEFPELVLCIYKAVSEPGRFTITAALTDC